ncbi:SGNH/GDSL hydrolase family protein [Streptomyces sp. NBC_01387]|uniref:SGNH/GDSL hydrolase family protein n=1 Tax=unclassified Streptomyces TaxID=2593676 RepID=UPI002025B5C1|nr:MULTISPECIES: SGNH/GDSL hydrolase family protein [unclassified Streptomyces]WSC22294.1 SGNH/GDSL hydrolase family protein [Streptomyces sp. NBC_01766]WSV56142.1 SGNH/GDSL hydrolase family protein [Streptomyces sp. NBC_01014]
MTRRHGYVLLAALAAVVTFVSVGIYAMVRPPATTVSSGTPSRVSSGVPASGTWTGTWSASPVGPEPGTPNGLPGTTVRNVVHTSIGGSLARITLSNLFGTRPLKITESTVAADNIVRAVTFDGHTFVTIPAGGQIVSDAVRIRVPADADVTVSVFSPSPSGPVTYHPHARQISYLSGGGRTVETPYWRYLTAVDVLTHEARGSVVVFGDSITDGITSTTGADHRWTDVLAQRLGSHYGVLNEGISGNRVLLDGQGQSGLRRFDRDALARSGARTVVIDLGVNDILRRPNQLDARQITDGLRRLAQEARARGLHVVGSTLMPFTGHRGASPQLEAVRQQVNATIRSGGVYDAVVDFDRALRDPYAPTRLLPAYDSGDHLHPNDAGYRKMAMTLDLDALSESVPARA